MEVFFQFFRDTSRVRGFYDAHLLADKLDRRTSSSGPIPFAEAVLSTELWNTSDVNCD